MSRWYLFKSILYLHVLLFSASLPAQDISFPFPPFEKLTTYQQFTNGQGKYEKKQHENEQPGVDPTPTLEGEREV